MTPYAWENFFETLCILYIVSSLFEKVFNSFHQVWSDLPSDLGSIPNANWPFDMWLYTFYTHPKMFPYKTFFRNLILSKFWFRRSPAHTSPRCLIKTLTVLDVFFCWASLVFEDKHCTTGVVMGAECQHGSNRNIRLGSTTHDLPSGVNLTPEPVAFISSQCLAKKPKLKTLVKRLDGTRCVVTVEELEALMSFIRNFSNFYVSTMSTKHQKIFFVYHCTFVVSQKIFFTVLYPIRTRVHVVLK